jgi:hypothetical protein
MFKRFDRSPFLLRLLRRVSDLAAEKRGLPVVLGIVLVVVSFALQLVDVWAEERVLQLLGVITLYAGVLISLIGLLLATPLGK